MSKKLGEEIKVVSAINVDLQAAGTLTGSVIDRSGFLDSVVHLRVGTPTGTPADFGVSLKVKTGNASDGSDLQDVTGATLAALTANNTESELSLDLNELKKYVAVVVTTTFTGGSTPKIPVAVTMVLGNSTNIPV